MSPEPEEPQNDATPEVGPGRGRWALRGRERGGRERGGPDRGRGCLGGCLILMLGVFAGMALLIVAGRMSLAGGEGMLHGLASFMTGRSTAVDVSQAAVVERIRKLSRLETVEYSMDKIVVGERQSSVLPDLLAGDRLLLIAHGEVIAGVDLSRLQPGDVTVSGDRVTLKMPKAMVLATRLDNAKTRVFSRETGLLVMADPNLETEVRKAAEEQIGQAAIEDGILDKAKGNAQASLEALLSGLGFRVVEVK